MDLVATDDEKASSTARIIHDVANDLTAISLQIELIARAASRAQAGESLDTLRRDLQQVREVASHASELVVALASENSAPAGRAGDPVQVPSAQPVTPARSGLPRILYVEDNDSNALLMRRIFDSRPSMELTVASTGAEALAVTPELDPALILMDLNLPDTTGDVLIGDLRREISTPLAPVVILTADAHPAQKATLDALGVAAYLTKPYNIDQLLGLIDQFTRTHRAAETAGAAGIGRTTG